MNAIVRVCLFPPFIGFEILSFTLVISRIVSFLLVSLTVMLSVFLSISLWVTCGCFSSLAVRVHHSAVNVIMLSTQVTDWTPLYGKRCRRRCVYVCVCVYVARWRDEVDRASSIIQCGGEKRKIGEDRGCLRTRLSNNGTRIGHDRCVANLRLFRLTTNLFL